MRIRRETVAEQCVQLLRRQILEWRLVPGEVVTEESIARDMGVSRPTVREVLNTLIVEGLLTRNPTTRSLCVTRLDCAEISEIYRVRRLLEAAGVRAFGALDAAALQPRRSPRPSGPATPTRSCRMTSPATPRSSR